MYETTSGSCSDQQDYSIMSHHYNLLVHQMMDKLRIKASSSDPQTLTCFRRFLQNPNLHANHVQSGENTNYCKCSRTGLNIPYPPQRRTNNNDT